MQTAGTWAISKCGQNMYKKVEETCQTETTEEKNADLKDNMKAFILCVSISL